MENEYLQRLIKTRNDLAKEREVNVTKRDAIVKVATGAGRDVLNDEEDREFRQFVSEVKRLDEELAKHDGLIAELDEEQQRKQDLRAGAAIAERAQGKLESVNEQATYDKKSQRSFFKDMGLVAIGKDADGSAAERLKRHAQDVATLPEYAEYRTGLTTGVGAGGAAVPPAYLLDQYITFARPGRPFADIVVNEPLPAGTMQVNVPKITSGTAVAYQAQQNTQVTETDLTDTYVTANVETIAGQQIMSRQLLERSAVSIDNIVFRDLIAAHAAFLDTAMFSGSGSSGSIQGINNITGINTIAVSGLTIQYIYAAIANAIQLVHSTRFLPPDAILMSPRRWGWFNSLLDTQDRPLFLPVENNPMNAGGILEKVDSQAVVGRIQGLPVIVDPNIPLTLGGGSNQDAIYVLRSSDLVLYESGVRAEAFPQTYANQMSVLLQVSSYVAFLSRYPSSIVEISGLTPPTWGS